MMRADPVPVIVCADDFGLSRGVNAGILELAEAGRISAAGCMTGLPAFGADAGRLKTFQGRLDLGVHLTLTDQEPLTSMPVLAPAGKLPSLGTLLKLGLAGRLPEDEIEREISAQIDRFAEQIGCLPDFVDGHQHVQQLPGINRICVDVVARLDAPEKPYIRACNDRLSAVLRRGRSVGRALAVGMFGHGLRRCAKRHGLQTNSGFSGFYDYAGAVDFADAFPDFLTAVVPGTLVFCHPGRSDAELAERDSLTVQRDRELAFMAGPAFPDLLAKAGVRLARFRPD